MRDQIKNIIFLWLNLIGIACLIGCASMMILMTHRFIIVGLAWFYEFNMIISILEFVMAIYGFLYGWYLVIKLYLSIK